MAITQVLRSRGDDPQRPGKDANERLAERMDILLKGLTIAEKAHGIFTSGDEKKALEERRAQAAKLAQEKHELAEKRLLAQEKRAEGVEARFLKTQEAQEKRFVRTQEQAAQLKREQMEFRRELAQEKKARDERLETARIDKETRTAVKELGKRVEVPQDLLTQIDELERTIGFELETYDPASNTAVFSDGKSKKVDIGGVSIPGMGRFGLGSDAESRMSAIFNRVLKDRSGAAVTETELLRLQNEFGKGNLNTEEQLINAMKRYKAASIRELKSIEGFFEPIVVQTANEHGGFTSFRFGPSPEEAMAEIQRRRAQQGETAEVPGLNPPGGAAPVVPGLRAPLGGQ